MQYLILSSPTVFSVFDVMMDDFCARSMGWNPHRSQRDALCCPIFPQYDDYGILVPFANRVPAVTRKVPVYAYDSEEDTESDSDPYTRPTVKKAERAAEAKVKATAEYEKAKAKVDEANKALEECEAKMHAASKKLAKLARGLEERRCAIRCY